MKETLVKQSGSGSAIITPPKSSAWSAIKKDPWLYILLIPGLLYFIIFKYLPMFGIIIAFQDYQPYLGILKSEWVGFEHFRDFFTNPDFFKLLRNTLLISLYNLVFSFPLPIVLALLLNEVKNSAFKRTVQTMVYVPHFISWVVIASITYVLLTTEGGVINEILFRLTGNKIAFLTDPKWFRPLIVTQTIWKETGWGTIIFLAALSGVDPTLYEAATVDGATRWQQTWYITLPAISSTIVIMLILRLGSILDTGFEQIFLMMNSLNREVADVFDTYVYVMGITQGAFSYSTAVGLFKSVVGLILIEAANYFARKVGETSLF
ncbi:ABC transporter permease [Mahella australiensis]|uniref:Carbohydrate ABC transporter membrane protein 1, CUT1 family n=1 Tax=Mahella australiensis (strain DSM 15567 / CIP 107919 / 50-1 BON) TaxID=697281 RepID=F3ZVX6_MAHA5|nr:sugar ABC transporter permease [Mahella australiensis]AEE95350.1 carbohydrate ABC transporter membrane protein 1, CUT1 family [Mahella australiensis 50-1 BON]